MAILFVVFIFWAKPTQSSVTIGFVLSLLGEALRCWALGYTGEHTRKQHLETEVLVSCGPYSLTRNPLYLGNILNATGVLIAGLGGYSWETRLSIGFFVWVTVFLLYWFIIQSEEEFLEGRFGELYRNYRKEVPVLLPKHWNIRDCSDTWNLNSVWECERSTFLWWSLVWILFLWRVW